MSLRALLTRLEKLEASIPVVIADQVEREPIDFGDLIRSIKAESARVAALGPVEKIRHYRRHIARTIAKAEAGPPPDRPGLVPGLAANLHAGLVHEVKQGFPSEYYTVRGCEIQLLRTAGYVVASLEAAHHDCMFHYQWRQIDNPLPEDARQIIADLLFEE